MVSKKKKKYSSGEGAQFMTRKAALKKLQLTLKDFRRICILKGIYPREPRNRKRAQKGAGGIKTLYHTKDIKFLLHEPIIWKLRELKDQSKTPRKRVANFTADEKALLAQLIKKHPIVESKLTDGKSVIRKKTAWELITVAFNSNAHVHKRDTITLKRAWDNMKAFTRKARAVERGSLLRTGGGPSFPPQPPSQSAIISLVEEVYQQKIRKARAMKKYGQMRKYFRDYPEINIDHIVKERYPTFVDALRDLDDCLTLCFLFSTFPSLKRVPRDQSMLCRRLTVEFMHAVIAAKALRKVFVSVKGYYYQAELEGQTITWIVPHHFSFQPQSKDDVDFKIMSTFVEFYTMMLGFVNFKLYHSLNLVYPPKLTSGFSTDSDKHLIDEHAYISERIAAMNLPLVRISGANDAEELPELDVFPTEDEDPQKLEEAKLEAEKIKKLKTIFKGLKFYINREVPREPLVFIIRCFGGEVSWDSDHFVGATFDESDESIAYQIVDRPSMEKQYLSRYYVQPQWVFDSVNARTLLPINKYLMGAVLPPHLSPFVDKIKDQVYIPPEQRALNDPDFKPLNDDEEGSGIEEASDEDNEGLEQESEEEGAEEALTRQYQQEVQEDSQSEDEAEEDDDNPEKKKLAKEKKKAMAVTTGVTHKEHPYQKEIEDKQAFRLREKLVRKKHRNLYKSMKAGQEQRKKEIWLLRKKRRLHDEKVMEEKKTEKRKQRMQALEAASK